jgi:uncharacterized protein YecE (DUF72 family)
VHAHGERVELKHQMFAPGEDVSDSRGVQTLDADSAVPADAHDLFADERPQLARGQMNRWTFHAGFVASFAPFSASTTLRSVLYVGTAGWNVPRAHRERFSADGSQLERYASKLNAAEINSSFYRPHAPETYERWAASVPPAFRFAVKIPKVISHERLLTRSREPLTRFLDETSGLGLKRGPLLLQLPPSFEFDVRRVGRFFDLLRTLYSGNVVCEPRNVTWTAQAANDLLARFEAARVAADPPRAPGLCDPAGWSGLVYYRWHGSPRPYFSCYAETDLARLAAQMRSATAEQWCIFDNTGSGSAAANALDLAIHLADGPAKDGTRTAQDRRRVARDPHPGAISSAPAARHRKSRHKRSK